MAKTIKLTDLSNAIDAAVEANAGKLKIPGGLILGRQIREALASKMDTAALAKGITKDMAASLPGFKLTPTVSPVAGGIITVGFIAKPAL